MESDQGTPWRRTLYVMWLAEFVAVSGISMVMPFLPLYVQELGVTDPGKRSWAGILVAANFASATALGPLWGLAGRPLRAQADGPAGDSAWRWRLVDGVARSPGQLLALRLLQGAVGGFVSAAVALVATAAPKERMGYALGTLQTAATTGHVIGPLFGGVLSDRLGYSHVFLITGGACVLAGLIVAVFVRENFRGAAAERHGLRDNLAMLRTLPALRTTFAVMFLTQIGLMVVQPVLPLFVQSLEADASGLLRTKVGLIFSMPGLAAVLAAPAWGVRGDRVGYRWTLSLALLGSGLLYLPHALVQSAAQLMGIRFAVGLCTAGIAPAANSMVASTAAAGRTAGALSLLSTAQWLGAIAGPLLGGALSAQFGIRTMFLVTGTLLLCSGTCAWRAAGKPVGPSSR